MWVMVGVGSHRGRVRARVSAHTGGVEGVWACVCVCRVGGRVGGVRVRMGVRVRDAPTLTPW